MGELARGGIGGRLDPLVGAVNHVPFRAFIDGAPLPEETGLEITLGTGEVLTAERGDEQHWWAALPEGRYDVRLIGSVASAEPNGLRSIEVQAYGVFPIPSLDFGR